MWDHSEPVTEAPSLTGVLLKLARAEEQLDAMEAEVTAYTERHPYEAVDRSAKETASSCRDRESPR